MVISPIRFQQQITSVALIKRLFVQYFEEVDSSFYSDKVHSANRPRRHQKSILVKKMTFLPVVVLFILVNELDHKER